MEERARRSGFDRRQAALARLGLLLIAGVVSAAAWQRSFHAVAWPDECIYLVGARNVIERQTLDTNFYLTHSLLRLGHPHRDVHMPGYVLALVPFVRLIGPTLPAAFALNVLLFLISVQLLFALARSLLEDDDAAWLAAALFAVLPPFPGYLAVAYPELLTAFALLASLAWSARGGGTCRALVAGALFAAGALVRETLLVALPLHLVCFRRRELLRGFAAGALATLLLAVAPLSRDRAVHPNALYPSLVSEALQSEAPLATLAGALWRNVERNLRDAAASEPTARAEDAVLVFMALLCVAAVAARSSLPPRARRWLLATAASLALLAAAVLTLYVVRERGGVWGGVRAFMAWLPLVLVFVGAGLAQLRRPPLRIAAVAAVVAVCLWLGAWQLRFFFRYKQSDREDQARYASYVQSRLDRLAPTRVVGRLFLYGYQRYPVEVIWSLPGDAADLRALEGAVPFDYVVLHWRSRLREAFVRNPRYVRLNRDDRDAELLIWRRLD